MNIDWTYRPSKVQSFATLVAHKPKLVAFTTSALIAGIGAVAIEFLMKTYSQQKRALPFSITVRARASWALTVLAGTALAYKLCRDQSSSYYSDFKAWGREVGSSVQCFYRGEDMFSTLVAAQVPGRNSFNCNKKNLEKILDVWDWVNALHRPTLMYRPSILAILPRIFDVKRLSTEDKTAFFEGFEDKIQARTMGLKQLVDRLTLWGNPLQVLQNAKNAMVKAEPAKSIMDIAPSIGDGTIASIKGEKGSVNEDHAFHQTHFGHQLLVVVDGHTDAGAVGQLMQSRFFSLIYHFLQKEQQAYKSVDYSKVLERAFKELDEEYFEQFNQGKVRGGGVAVAVLIPPDQNTAYVATLGDCEAVILRKGKIRSLSVLGNWTNRNEKSRVKDHLNNHNVTCNNQLSNDLKNGLKKTDKNKNPSWPPGSIPGSCQTSRSIGDFNVKYASNNMDAWIAQVPKHNSAPPSITALPEEATPIILNTPLLEEWNLQAGDVFVLGSDGLFENLTHKEIKDIAENKEPNDLAQLLVNKALENNRKVDDITCLAYQVRYVVTVH